VEDSCKYPDEPACSGATELVIQKRIINVSTPHAHCIHRSQGLSVLKTAKKAMLRNEVMFDNFAVYKHTSRYSRSSH
jgi:hypothetical protein